MTAARTGLLAGRPVLRLLHLARPAWPRLLGATAAGSGAAAAGIALTATSAWLISRAAQHPPILYLMIAIVAVRAFGLGRGLLHYVERLVGHDAALRILGDLRARIYTRLTRLVPAAATDLHGGDLVTRFVADVDAALDILIRVVLPYAIALCVATGSTIVLATMLPPMGLVLAAGLTAVIAGVPVLHAAISRHADRRLAPLRGRLTDQTVALLTQLPDLVAYQATDPILAALDDTDRELRRTTIRSGIALGATVGLTAATAGACAVFGLVLGADAVAGHRLDPVLLAVLVLTPLAVFEALSGLPVAAAGLRTGRAALARVFAIIDRADPVPDPAEPHPVPSPPFHLRVRDVSARWTQEGPDVLAHVDLDLAPGSRTVIAGPSGSGKTTVAALLGRLLDPTAGAVTINGTDLRDLSGEEVRRIIGIVDDRAYLFDGTIAANLRIGAPQASDAQLYAALARARLNTWVHTLPNGLETAVGEHGAHLSGGQRRRLALARALLADHPILVLDEPTEHLDEPIAAALIGDLLAAATGRTVVLITHRPYDPLSVDQVIRMSGGRASDDGSAVGRRRILRVEEGGELAHPQVLFDPAPSHDGLDAAPGVAECHERELDRTVGHLR
jgi:thiol reductant ABC exporter CydC subunit